MKTIFPIINYYRLLNSVHKESKTGNFGAQSLNPIQGPRNLRGACIGSVSPQAFELVKIGLFKFPPLGQKSHSNAPPISTELPLLKDKFRFQSNTLYAFQRVICHNDTFKLLLKTNLKALFTNKGETLSCKSVKPCKNRKNSRAYYVRTRDKSGSNSPPFQCNIQIPPSPGTMYSQMPGVRPGGGGGGFEVSN